MSKVTVKQLVDEISFAGEDQSSYYDIEKDSIVLVSFDEVFSEEEDLELEDIEGNTIRFLPLPSHRNWDFNEYEFMERFIETLEEGEEKAELYDAIVGRGAFRRFKDRCEDFGLLEDWYAFRDECLKEVILEWAKENELEFDEV